MLAIIDRFRSSPSDETLDAETARWLVGAEGLETVAEAHARLREGASTLEVVTGLRDAALGVARAAAAVEAATARERDRTTHHRDEPLVFTRIGLEQSSHPDVSRWRARRYAGSGTVVDLCAGVGGDTIALAAAAGAAVAVDLDAARLTLLRHNAAVVGVDAWPVRGDALSPPVDLGGAVHVDPARRAGGRRVRRLADYRPAVPALLQVLRDARGSGVVLSPGVDLSDPDLPDDGELEFIQVGADLVEAVLWTGELASPGVRSSATLLPEGLHLQAREVRPELEIGPVGAFLVEVAPAAVRARLHDHLGERIGARRLARRRALLTTDDDPGDAPWWRVWPVEADLPLRAKAIRAWLREHGEAPIEIATHGVDHDPTELWRAIGKPPRGVGGRRLHLVRTDEGGRCVVTDDRGPARRTPPTVRRMVPGDGPSGVRWPHG